MNSINPVISQAAAPAPAPKIRPVSPHILKLISSNSFDAFVVKKPLPIRKSPETVLPPSPLSKKV